MKGVLKMIIIIMVTIISAKAQDINRNKTIYGVTFSQFKSNSGFQPGYEIHFTLQPNAKAKVGFGLFIDNETKEFAGISINHQRMLFAGKLNKSIIQPLIFYHFIYRKSVIPSINNRSEIMGEDLNWATYTSLEHHLGVGINFNISKNLLLESGLGYGIYLGSIKKPSGPDPFTGEISGSNGNGIIFKTGLGFKF